MNLKQLCKALGELARAQQLVNFSAAGASLAELNPIEIDWYPVFFIIPSGIHTVLENTTRYGLVLYYIDRLIQDNYNSIDVFSSSVENLKNIVIGAKGIEGVVGVQDGYTIRNFMPEKMNDLVCGAYAEVQIEVKNDSICYEENQEN
jgi:hypothetical protein